VAASRGSTPRTGLENQTYAGGDDATKAHETRITDDIDTKTQNRLQTIYADGEAHVEDFRIKRLTFSDE
jgi:hypothetical protein